MEFAFNLVALVRATGGVIGIAAGLALGGCAAHSHPPLATLGRISTSLSPVAEEVAPQDAWRLAEAYSASHPGTEVLVGRGDSMLPLYHDRTVLVVERWAMRDLHAGLTVIFVGARGRPVAHTLTEKTPRGWRTMGVGNREPDDTTVRFDNYVGTVVKAYAPKAVIARLEVTGLASEAPLVGRIALLGAKGAVAAFEQD